MASLRKTSSCTLLTEVSAYRGQTDSEKQATPFYRNFDKGDGGLEYEERDVATKYGNLQISVDVCDEHQCCGADGKSDEIYFGCQHTSSKTTSESSDDVTFKDRRRTYSNEEMTNSGGYFGDYDDDDDVFHRFHNRRRIFSTPSLDFLSAERVSN